MLAVAIGGFALLLFRHGGERQASLAQSTSPPAGTAPQPIDQVDPELVQAQGLSRAFRIAAQKVLPAVVVIKAGPSPVCPHCGRAHDVERQEGEASLDILGSGFIVDPTGVVLTNKHVVKDSPSLVVQTADGKQFRVAQISSDPEHDAAVLRLADAAPLPFAGLGDSESVEIGDWVLTIGCPLELDKTVSAGIISAKNRSFCKRHQARYLQTDAVVNPGSSGGPLVALNGTVIGITTAIASEDGGYQGIGFAVPANLVKQLVAQFGKTSGARLPGGDSIFALRVGASSGK